MKIHCLRFLLVLLSLLAAGLAQEAAADSEGSVALFKHGSDVAVEAITESPTAIPTARPTAIPTAIPTIVPTFKPTAKPTPKPSGRPTRAPTKGIYLGNTNIDLKTQTRQAIVGTLTILLFVLMACELLSPEILFMIALIIILLCQILSLSEALSGLTNSAVVSMLAHF